MKRSVLTIVFACCLLALAAQDSFRVKYQGSKPTISDFAWAFLSSGATDDDGCIDESTNAFKQAWIRHRKGAPQTEGDKLTIDKKNGYVLYESRYDEHLLKVEMCYWNEADQKHKLIAYNVQCFSNGKHSPGQYDGLIFFRYDNASKKMTQCDAPGFDVQYGLDDGATISYSLPRKGKDITVTYWYPNDKKQKTLKWKGHKFTH